MNNLLEEYKEENFVWHTRYGEPIPVRAMSTDHILNCMRMFKDTDWETIFDLELSLRALENESYEAYNVE